jgi:glycine betaine/proline transport system substrate-binding protein
MRASKTRRSAAVVAALMVVLAACGDDSTDSGDKPSGSSVPDDSGEPAPGGEGAAVTLAINPWTGSAVNAQVAKVVMESKLNTSVSFVEIDEFATWPGMDAGDIDAVLEVWPSGHAADYETYIEGKKSVVDLGLLGPEAKIGWYVPKFVVDEHPELATWEGFKDPELAGLFATAESGDQGQFLMGDPSYVTFDEQIIANLGLPLKYVVAGSEAALIETLRTSVADQQPVLVQFWKPHWLHLELELVEVQLPDVTDECLASAAASDGSYACDYAADPLYKAAAAGLESKNGAAFNFLKKFQLTTEQQSEIAGYIDRDGMDPAAAAEKWVADNAAIVDGWLA